MKFMKKLLFIPLFVISLMQCAWADTTEDLINKLSVGNYDAFSISDVQIVLTPKEKVALELSKAFRDSDVSPALTENGRVTYAYGLTTPSIICAPLMVTDIEFEAGEMLNDVVMGDTSRWQVTLARAGIPEANHLIVKPLDAGLHTTAIITTNKRVYHIELRSQAKEHMPYVGFVYPEDANKILQAQLSAQRKEVEYNQAILPTGESVDVSSLNFDYTLSGSSKIKPVQVYDDGRQTYIKMPDSIKEMPVLMVRNNGNDILVNYRIQENTLIVDEIFSEAVLLAGVGRNQEKVTIKASKR